MMLILALALVSSSQLDRCLDTGAAAQGMDDAMAACFSADFKRADARLNATYRATMMRLPAARQTILRSSQRAWINQRDAACPLNTDPGAGTIERSNHPACLTKQTNRRVAWLTRFH